MSIKQLKYLIDTVTWRLRFISKFMLNTKRGRKIVTMRKWLRMARSQLRSLLHRLQRLLQSVRRKRNRKKVIGLAMVVISLAAIGNTYRYHVHNIDTAAYRPLLSVIAQGESNGNYNAYFGNAANTNVRFTEMTLTQVLQWQTDYVRQGHKSSAVGKYQIIRPTLSGLIKQLELDPQTPFDEALQDRLAITLMERRGAQAFVDRKLSREQFTSNLAREWAALPKVIGPNQHESYYAGDGINAARISIDEVYSAITRLEAERLD